MKKTVALLSVVLSLGALLFTSCSFGGGKHEVTIYDGSVSWSTFHLAKTINATTPEGDVAMWCPMLQAQVGDTLRCASFMINTCEPGTYSGVYNPNTKKWSSDVIGSFVYNLDYDNELRPTWYGQTVTITIHKYNKKAHTITATLNAVVQNEATSETRNIRIEMKNMVVSD